MDNILFGNEESIQLFESLIGTGKLAHAYLLVGNRGSGKKTMCKQIVLRLAEKSIKSDPSLFNRINDGNCPDVKYVRREDGKKSMGVDLVRNVIEDTSMTPFELDFKMYIFEEAELLTVQAQNSLLKVIEEPPANVYFMLLTTTPSSLIPTVRSRVQTIKMQSFTSERILNYLEEKRLLGVATQEQIKFALDFSDGAIGKATMLLKDGDADYSAYSSTKRIVDVQSRKGVGGNLIDIIKEVKSFVGTSDKRGQLSLLLTYLFKAYRDLLSLKISESYTSVFFNNDEANTCISRLSLETIQQSVNVISTLQKDSAFNYNITAAYNVLAIGLWEAA